MPSRVRLMLLALLAVFAFGAVATAVAQAEEAPFWSIGGSRLGAGETHYFTLVVYSSSFHLLFLGIAVLCGIIITRTHVILGSNSGNPGIAGGAIEFSSCKTEGSGKGCKIAEPIVTNNLKEELVETEKGEKGSLLMEFFPEKGAKLATLHFEPESGGSCTVKEAFVEGSVAGQVFTDPGKPPELGELVQLPNGKKEATSWLINFPTTPIKKVWLIKGGVGSEVSVGLLAATEEATLSGTAVASLAKKNSKGELESEEVKWSPLP